MIECSTGRQYCDTIFCCTEVITLTFTSDCLNFFMLGTWGWIHEQLLHFKLEFCAFMTYISVMQSLFYLFMSDYCLASVISIWTFITVIYQINKSWLSGTAEECKCKCGNLFGYSKYNNKLFFFLYSCVIYLQITWYIMFSLGCIGKICTLGFGEAIPPTVWGLLWHLFFGKLHRK